MTFKYILTNKSGSDGTFLYNNQYYGLVPGGKVILDARPETYSFNITLSMITVDDKKPEILRKIPVKQPVVEEPKKEPKKNKQEDVKLISDIEDVPETDDVDITTL